MKKYPIVPGRGLVTKSATNERLAYLKNLGYPVSEISATSISVDQVQNNIESYIGSVEIPIGMVGPLLFNNEAKQELVYTPAGTLEGALIASMNRGARAVTMSGGFSAAVIHQKMIRSPMFIFNNLDEAIQFKNWIDKNFENIKKIAGQYSNHAQLQSISPIFAGRSVHLKFVYTTGDASGQNMTTTCTWHAILWVHKHFVEQTGVEPSKYIIEGNGASDKKVSHFSTYHGRGIHVIAECEIDEQYINKILRTTSDDFIRSYNSSMTMNHIDGMVGYNTNVANAIAAIFVATGQDLASIHESGVGILSIEKTTKGLYFSLHLPSLVIGTIGGGTHLPKQKEALTVLGCSGTGKVKRFAQIIAGFALSLEISTFAAIVGGQFASSHEKLGRNKPVNWLTLSEINTSFIQKSLIDNRNRENLLSIKINNDAFNDNGILINLARRISKKLIGFIVLDVIWKDDETRTDSLPDTFLIKSKPLDREAIKGLHLMASAIDPEFARLILQFQEVLEYNNCHTKEIKTYELLQKYNYDCMPSFYGQIIDNKREIYFLLQEFLQMDDMRIMNSENQPELWNNEDIINTMQTIHKVHSFFDYDKINEELPDFKMFEPWKAKNLYYKMADIIINEYDDTPWANYTFKLKNYIDKLEEENRLVTIHKTIVHNDFNSRNIAVRKDDRICIYDWELAVINFPQRDVVEFLSFVLPLGFNENDFKKYIEYYFSLWLNMYPWDEFKMATIYSIKEYIVTRVLFYLSGRIILEFEFAERIFLNAMRMLEILENGK